MKNQEFQQRVENYKLIQQLLIKCQEQFLTIIQKIQLNLEDKIQQKNQELQQSQSQSNEQKIEDQIEILSKNYYGNYTYKIPFQFNNIDQENQFFNEIKQQLLSFNNNQSYIQLMKSLSEMIIDEKIKDQITTKILPVEKFENDSITQQQQTPSLNIKCNKHGKKIILLNLDPNQVCHSRKVCIDCICENDPIKYTSLNEADKRWKAYKEQTSNLIKEYIKNRIFKQQQIIIILEDIRDIIKQLQFELNIFENDNIIQELIYDLAEDQIDEIVRTLSQSDLFKVLIDQQNKYQAQDQIFYKNIAQDIFKHIQQDFQASRTIFNISKSDFSQQQSYCKPSDAKIQTEQNLQDQEENLFIDEDFSKCEEYISKFRTNSTQLKKLDQIEKELNLNQLELAQVRIEKKNGEESQLKQMIELKQIQDNYAQEIVNLKTEKSKIQENLNQNKTETNSRIQILEQQLKEKKEELDKFKIQILPENFQKLLKYSNNYKSNNCSISDCGKIAECSNGCGFCICEQVIPKVGITKFAFQVIEKSDWLFFGIGMREIIKEKQFGSNYTLNCGSYLIAHDANVFSNHDSKMDGRKLSFPFGQNDSIIIEVNMDQKQIKWTKAQSNESCVIDIDTSKELYPCALLYSKAKIKILNDIPK